MEQPDIKQQIATMIREARKSKGLTQEELGERIGVTKAAINSYETGKQNLTVMTLQKLSIALGEPLQISLGK